MYMYTSFWNEWRTCTDVYKLYSVISSATIPGTPGVPVLRRQSGIVEWSVPASDGGAPIEEYLLEARREETTYNNTWTVVYNASKPHWVVDGLASGQEAFVFRVSARNAIGWSNISAESTAYKHLPLTVGKNQCPFVCRCRSIRCFKLMGSLE